MDFGFLQIPQTVKRAEGHSRGFFFITFLAVYQYLKYDLCVIHTLQEYRFLYFILV